MSEKEIESPNLYDPEILAMLYARRENHFNGQSDSYTIEEVCEWIKGLEKRN